MIVHRNNNTEFAKLHVNSSSGQQPVMIQVYEDGDYYVTVFQVNQETGIVGTNVAFSLTITLMRETGKFLQ